ncbi:histidine kinase [Actinomadura sp. NPDC048021]|uniref:sensor histidine kinase n=1 Tax=Actinomadura sp. NPDC048021 TaxID=3155385 RepID=UPI0033C39A66
MRTDESLGRWPRPADVGVPLAVAGVQLSGTWFLAEGGGEPLGGARWPLVAGSIVLAAAALVWRRVAPVPVLAAAISLSASAIVAAGTADTAVSGLADGVALYSVAVHRERRDAVLGCLAAYTVAFAVYLPYARGPGDLFSNEFLDGVLYLGIAAFGQLRRQREAVRSGLRARLADIESESRAAAEAERERLAREVHDIAGHHLSAVAVHTGAAARRADSELVAQALAVAAETGREVLRSLSGLVDVVAPRAGHGGLKELLPPLCQGLNRLGIPVSLRVEGRARRLPAELTTTAYRIVQESLTNVMRYSAGAEVRVSVRYAPRAVRLTIENDAAATRAAVPALGGGRGIQGMRERAAGLGGVLTAGPTAAGGWSVAAHLPSGPRHRRGWPEILDGVAVALCAFLPLLGFVPPDPLVTGRPGAELLLIGVALTLRAVPLWWRRHAPRAVLALIVSADAALAVAWGLWSRDLLGLLVLGSAAELVAVYSLACYRPDGARTWPAALAAPLPWGLGLGFLLVADHEVAADGPTPVAFAFGLVTAVVCTAPLTLAAWTLGVTTASRSRRWGESALDAVSARAGDAVQAERDRVAAGLNGTVLHHTVRLVTVAEAGLSGTDGDAHEAVGRAAELARAALTEMRALLDAWERT